MSPFSGVLPAISNVSYTSVSEAGNTTFTLPTVIVSPRKRIEGGPSYGAYKRRFTTFKIDPFVWSVAQGLLVTGGPAPGIYIYIGGSTWTWIRTDGLYGFTSDGRNWLIVNITTSIEVDASSTGILGTYLNGSVVTATAGVTPFTPKLRDQLIDENGDTWTVHKDVDDPTNFGGGITGLWRLPCVLLEIDPALADTVQYYATTCAGSSDTGSRTVTQTATGSVVAAAIQPFNADLGEQFGVKNFSDHYMIYLVTDPSGTGVTVIEAGDLFVSSESITYENLSVESRNSLDELSTFHCVKKL